MFIGVDATQV